jgi:phosphoesterase RecJ-like protein
MQKFKQRLIEEIEKSTGRIFITSHMKPDYDSMCSSIALLKILRKKFPDKFIQILISDIHINEWDDLYEKEDVIWIDQLNKNEDNISKKELHNMFEFLTPSDVLIGLDGNSYDRFVPADSRDIRAKMPFFQSIKTFIIDHHQGEPDACTASYIESTATSTCEILAKMFKEETENQEIAKILIWGIMTDTGFFEFIRIHNVDIFDTIKSLFLKTGYKSIEEVKSRFKTDEVTFDYLQVIHSNRQKNTKEQNGLPLCVYSYVNTKDYTDETKRELANAKSMFFGQAKRIERFQLFWIVSPTSKTNQYSIAFRSKEGLDVATLAEKYFGGGGHTNASGGRYKLTEENLAQLEKERAINPSFGDGEFVNNLVMQIMLNDVEWSNFWQNLNHGE